MSLFGKNTKKETESSSKNINKIDIKKFFQNLHPINIYTNFRRDIIFLLFTIHFTALLYSLYCAWDFYYNLAFINDLIKSPFLIFLIILAILTLIAIKTKKLFLLITAILIQIILLFLVNYDPEPYKYIFFIGKDHYDLNFRAILFSHYLYNIEYSTSIYKYLVYIQKITIITWISIALFLSLLAIIPQKIKSSIKLISSLIYITIAIAMAMHSVFDYRIRSINSLNNNKSSEITYNNLYSTYDLERSLLIVGNDWDQIILPGSEIMKCYEGNCFAFWRSTLNNDKVLKFSIINCPNSYDELKKYCGNNGNVKLVIESHEIITNQDMDDILLKLDIFNSE